MKDLSRNKKRAHIISYLYQFELMETPLESNTAFESGDFTSQDIKIIDNIARNYEIFKSVLIKHKGEKWTWERISPFIRATLIYGSFELQVSDIALVIDSLVKITKAYVPDDSYKFVNAILENVGVYYAKQNKAN